MTRKECTCLGVSGGSQPGAVLVHPADQKGERGRHRIRMPKRTHPFPHHHRRRNEGAPVDWKGPDCVDISLADDPTKFVVADAEGGVVDRKEEGEV